MALRKILNKKLIQIIIVLLIALILVVAAIFSVEKVFNVDILSSIASRININPEDNSNQNTDIIPLEIIIETKERRILEGMTATKVVSNKDITVENEEKFKLIYIDEVNGQKQYVLEIYNIGIGTAVVNIAFKDSDGQSKTIPIEIVRENYTLPFGLKEVEDWENSTYIIDGEDLLAPVDKQHKLVNDFEPSNLVNLFDDKSLLVQTENMMLRSDAAEYLSIMLQNLKKETGKVVLIASAYRPFNNQLRNYTESLRTIGQTETDKIIARPGFSEHQLGTAVDFQTFDSGYTFTNEFDNTEAGKWLKENAHRYGFVQSYPQGKEEITGYSYEAWHYRYIGVENASQLKESGLTLKEWISQNRL